MSVPSTQPEHGTTWSHQGFHVFVNQDKGVLEQHRCCDYLWTLVRPGTATYHVSALQGKLNSGAQLSQDWLWSNRK